MHRIRHEPRIASEVSEISAVRVHGRAARIHGRAIRADGRGRAVAAVCHAALMTSLQAGVLSAVHRTCPAAPARLSIRGRSAERRSPAGLAAIRLAHCQRRSADRNCRDRASIQHAGESADMVGVPVGEHQQRDRAHAEPIEAGPSRGRIGAGVDDDVGAIATQHNRIPLPDITHRYRPACRRPARLDRAHRHDDDGETDECGGTEAARPAVSQTDDRRRDRDDRQRNCCRTTRHGYRRGRQRRRVLGNRDQPPQRQCREPSDGHSERQPRHTCQCRRRTDHRDRRDDKGDKDVRDDRHEADGAGERHDDRYRNGERRRAHRHNFGEPARNTLRLKPIRPTRGEHDKCGGSRYRECEPVVRRERG